MTLKKNAGMWSENDDLSLLLTLGNSMVENEPLNLQLLRCISIFSGFFCSAPMSSKSIELVFCSIEKISQIKIEKVEIQ